MATAKQPASWMYDLILTIFAPLIDLFFREVQVRGAWRVPTQGAVILVAAPHANQFVDSLVLMRIMRSLNRRVSWLMAAKSFDKPIIGPLATLAGAVPVSRAMDNVRPATGTIFLPDPMGNPRILAGIGTRFDGSEFQVGGAIYLPAINGESHKLDIAEIRGPEEILLKIVPTHEDVLQQLSNPIGTKFKVAPHVDQTGVYDAVFDRLRKAGCIGIFPEGGSHDRSDMLPLKAGISIMALGALAENINLAVVPVGLNYFHAHKFRSRAVVEFGDPIEISPEFVTDFKNGKRRESVGGLLACIYQSLAAVTMAAPDFDTLNIVHTARRLYIPRRHRVHLSSVIEINRRLIKGYSLYKTDPKIHNLSKALHAYNAQLQSLGLRDHQVEYARFSSLRILSLLIYRMGKLALLTIGTLPGLALFSPVFVAARYYSHKKTKEALAGSNVKIKGTDVMATWKILVAGILAPLLYTYYAIILTVWAQYNRLNGYLPENISIWSIILSAYLVFPTVTYAALRLGEIGMDIIKSLKPLFLCLSPTSVGTLTQLREERAYLARQVTELVNTLGPDLYPDCDAAKLPQPRQLYRDISPEDSMDDLAGSEFF